MSLFGREYLYYLEKQARPHLQAGIINDTGTHFIISRKGRFLTDGISADLFR